MSGPSHPDGWVVVVPVRPAGKSRLGASPEFARAIALDTIEAALAAASVAEVVVPTADAVLAESAAALGARVVAEADTAGISLAIARALEGVGLDRSRAVLLGDLPALRPAELDTTLALAGQHSHSFVRDADGTGTTLVTAAPGRELKSAFGADSAARHSALGLTALGLDPASTVRRDVDTPADLVAAAAFGLGPRTSALHA